MRLGAYFTPAELDELHVDLELALDRVPAGSQAHLLLVDALQILLLAERHAKRNRARAVAIEREIFLRTTEAIH